MSDIAEVGETVSFSALAALPEFRQQLEAPEFQLPRIQRMRRELGIGVTPLPRVEFDFDAFSLARYQTMPFRDQGGRGTCWAFAGVAAMEAAYKRRYGLELDLSEQYVFH